MTRPTEDHPLRLRRLGPPGRLGVAGLAVTAIAGAAASGMYLAMHHEERDERSGLTVDDVRAHYHGIVSEAPLLASLRTGHPEELGADLADRDRELLIDWLTGDPARLSPTYDSLDLGADAPAEIIAVSCLDCHARSSEGEHAAPGVPLEYWDDVEALSISREVRPMPLEVLANSTHTHALGMSAIGIALSLLALLTSWPRVIVGAVIGLTGVGLALDISGWWITRAVSDWAYVVIAGGAAYTGGLSLLGVLVLADLCMPGPRRGGDAGGGAPPA